MSARVLAAAFVLPDSRTWLEGGGLLVHRGRVVRLLRSPAAVVRASRSAPRIDLGDCVLTPGLVNAHAHLELSGLSGRMPRKAPFGRWVARLLELRAQRGARGLASDARAGAARCLATGTTLVGDVDTSGAGERGLTAAPRLVH